MHSLTPHCFELLKNIAYSESFTVMNHHPNSDDKNTFEQFYIYYIKLTSEVSISVIFVLSEIPHSVTHPGADKNNAST